MEINYNRLAKAITRAGVILVKNGAEISRVEDTMERLCFAYGANTVDSYATPTILIISFSMEDDSELYHNIKRVSAGSVNLNKIDMVNSLSREIQKNVLSIEEFNSKLDVIEKDKGYGDVVIYFGALICSFGFGIFFGGGISECLLASFTGVLTKAIMVMMERINLSSFIRNVIGGLILTVLSYVLSMFFVFDRNIVSMSAIMLLVPGLSITNAIRDSVNGDALSSLSRMTEALVVAIAIALGSLIGLMISGYII